MPTPTARSALRLAAPALSLIALLVLALPAAGKEAAEEKIERPGTVDLVTDQWIAGEDTPTWLPAPGILGTDKVELHLTIDECVDLALANNLELALQRLYPFISDTGIALELGTYDLNIFADGSYLKSKEPTSSFLSGADILEQETFQAGFGLQKMVSTGALLELRFTALRLWTNSAFFPLNPNIGTSINFTIAQPLLKGGGLIFSRSRLRLAHNIKTLSVEQYRRFVEESVASVDLSYWDLVLTGEVRKLKENSLQLARDLVENSEKMVSIGTLAPMEVLVAETQAAAREEEVLIARNAEETARDRLQNLLNLPEDRSGQGVSVIPTVAPTVRPFTVNPEEAYYAALNNRSDYQSLKIDRENKAIQERIASNALLPSLDLFGGVGMNGLGGDVRGNDEDPNTTCLDGIAEYLGKFLFSEFLDISPEDIVDYNDLDGGLSRSLDNLFSGDYPEWNVGLRFSIPIGNRTGKSQYARARFEARQSEIALTSLERLIALDLRSAIRQIDTALQRIETTAATVRLADRRLAAEEKKLKLGLTTTYQVLEAQEDLTEAKNAELRAKTDYVKALTNFERVTGTLLENRGIEPEEDFKVVY